MLLVLHNNLGGGASVPSSAYLRWINRVIRNVTFRVKAGL
jgi:hypothetical protein